MPLTFDDGTTTFTLQASERAGEREREGERERGETWTSGQVRHQRSPLSLPTLQASPIVRFVSRPADALGFHSLVQTAELAFDLPPFATVRLEEVLPPRRWRANGKLIQQRGLAVSVTFG